MKKRLPKAVPALFAGLLCMNLLITCEPLGIKETIINAATRPPSWGFMQKLSAGASGSAGANYGAAVAVSDTYLIVGAYKDAGERGAIYTYRLNSSRTQWIPDTPQKISGENAGDRFGFSVALLNNRMIVGAPYYNCTSPAYAYLGAAYVYENNGSGWAISNAAGLTGGRLNLDGEYDTNFYFGHSVGICNEFIIVGATYGDTYKSGAGFIYRNSTFDNRRRFDGQNLLDRFGYSVAISSSTAVFGACYFDGAHDNSGAIYISTYANASWSDQELKTNSDPMDNGYFGRSISLSGSNIIIGADRNNTAYIFRRNGNVWSEIKKINNPENINAPDDQFGYAVAANGTYYFVGAPQYDLPSANAGRVYVFDNEFNALKDQYGNIIRFPRSGDPPVADSDKFGSSIALSGAYLVIGVPNDDVDGADSGSVYVYALQ